MTGSDLIIALPKGRLLAPSVHLFKKMGLLPRKVSPETRRLHFRGASGIHFLILRATDVPTYVEYGAADVGIVGKDLLLEQGRDLFEPVDLQFGHCRLVVAVPTKAAASGGKLKIATKYPNLTERHFSEKGVPVEIIKLYGSIELAPMAGLANRIVDLSATGETLRQHGLAVEEEICRSTARLIVNRASLRTKHPRVYELIEAVRGMSGSR